MPRLKDCLDKTTRIDRHVKRAMVGRARGYAKEGLGEKEASLKAVGEFHTVIQDNLSKVEAALKAPAAPQKAEPTPAPEPKAELSNEEQLDKASSIKVDAPSGATFLRATDAQGRVSEESLKGANKGLNVFQGAGPWAKVEAGTRDRKGNFVPTEGPVTVQDRAQADLAKKLILFPKNQQAKAQKAITVDDSPDPYKGAALDDRGPLRPEQNIRLISELGRIGALNDDATAKSVLESISNDKKSPEWARVLAGKIAPLSEQLGIEAVYRPQSTWAALYSGKGENGRILINTAARNPGVAATVMHEAAHHVTLSKIEGKVKLNETEQAAVQNLQDLFEKAKKAYKGDKAYGFKDLGEFVSEAFSNAGFRAKLDNLTLEGDRVPLLQRLSNAIARLVWGRPVATGSLLESAIQNAMDLAGEPVIESSVAAMEQRESALGMAGSWASSLFHPNASPEAQAKAAGELLQAAAVPAPPTEQEIKPLTLEQGKLVTDNLSVAGFWAKKFSNIPGTTWPERNSEARMALIKAAQNYDPSKGEFKAYASWAVKNKLIGLYKSTVKQASREVSANTLIPSNMATIRDVELQDTLEAPLETPPIDTGAIDILNKAKEDLSPRDRKIFDDYSSGMTLDATGQANGGLSREGVRKIIKRSGRKIIQDLADAGITDIESIFPKQEERTQVLSTKPVSLEDENADTSETVGQLEAKDIERSEPLPDEDLDEDVVAPLSPEGQKTRVPWLAVKKGAYRPLGKAFSAGGGWSKELFDALKTKNQKVRAALTHVEFADREMAKYLKKTFLNKKIAAPIDAINTAFASAGNKLTKDQQEAAKGMRQQDKAAFLQTARLENLDAFKQRKQAALLSLPKDLQVLVTERRDAIDALSRELINRGDITDSLKFTIDENLETYQHRSYAIFDGDEHAKWVMSDDPEAKKIRNRVEALFTQDARARAATQYATEQRKAGTPVTKTQAIAHVSGLDVTPEVRKMIHDYKSVADGTVLDIMRGKVPGQSDRSILKVRGDIPEEVRDFWGEHKDLSVNYAKTYTAVTNYLADLDLKTEILNDGLAKGYLWKDGVSTDPFPENVVKLFGKDSKSMGPLDGVYGPPILRDAFAELDQQYTKDWLTTMTSFALQAKTKYSNIATVRNFIGNGSIMAFTGNLFSGGYGKAALATVANFRKLGDKEIQEYVADAVRHGVFGDNVGPGILREMAARAAGIKDLPTGAIVRKAGTWVDKTSSGIYGGVDDFWKVVSWEAEKSQLKWAVPGLSEAENKERAAAITRRTVPTYSEAFKWSQELFNKNILGKFIAPFTTFITEIVRVTGGNIMQAKEEIMSGNPQLQYIGTKRIAWMFATYLGWKAAVAASKYWNDYDDEDDEALRRQLPDWQKDAMLFYLPKTKEGHPRFLDISYLNPYNYIFDPIDTVVNAFMHGKGAVEMGVDASISVVKQIFKPFISNQLFIGAVQDAMHNQKPSGAPIYNELDPWDVKTIKISGYVGAALEPGLLTSGKGFIKAAIGYKERGGKEYDMLSQVISLAGQRVTAHDPKQSFQYQVGEFKRHRQSASYMFSYIANSQGTVGPGDVANAYRAANKANKEVAQNLRSNYLAVQTLGVSKDSAQQTLKSQGAGMDAKREAESGVYTRYAPDKELLKEIEAKFPNRYKEFERAYVATPEQEALE